jgi:hypothetical protein
MNMYTSINVLKVAGFRPPVPIFLPLVGGTVFFGDFIIRRTVTVDERFPHFQFKVVQIVEKMPDADITVNCFATEEQCIHAHLPGAPELLIPFTSLKTDIDEKCKTHTFVSLAYIDHIENKADMLVDPEGIINTYIVASQNIVGRDPSAVPFPPNQHFSSSSQVYKHHYPRLSSMPRRMFEACRAIRCTSVSMLSKGAINQSLSNTRRMYVEKDIFAVTEKGLNELTKDLHVKVATTDVHVTVIIHQLRVIPNTDVQVSSTTFRDLNKGRKNRKLFHTSQQVNKLKRCFGANFGYGSRSPYPMTSVTKESGANYVEQCHILHDRCMLNSILNLPSYVTAAVATLVHTHVRGLPNGLVLTYQDIKNSVVLSMRFDKVRSGNRAETLRAEADAQYVPPRPVHIINENLMAPDSRSLGSQVSHRASLAGSEYSPELGDCFTLNGREYSIISMHNDSLFLCRDIQRLLHVRLFSRDAIVHLTAELGSIDR